MMGEETGFKDRPIPETILIVGSGVFGLSTAYALATDSRFQKTKITVVDRQAFPAPDASSIDSSRIIRADYANAAYSDLAFEAQTHWRGEWGADGRYSEDGLLLVAHKGQDRYVRESLANVKSFLSKYGDPTSSNSSAARTHLPPIEELNSPEAISKVLQTGGTYGETGYLNRTSGWADAEASMRYLYSKFSSLPSGKVTFITAPVTRLAFTSDSASTVAGVHLNDGRTLTADLTILATGAWTPSLLDMRGIAVSTGQIIAYGHLTPTEQTALSKMPTCLNLTTGLFIITPSHQLLKIARHGHGYTNPTTIPHPEPPLSSSSTSTITVSLPYTTWDNPSLSIPPEALSSCTAALAEITPTIPAARLTRSRLCWYTDTRTGDFIIDYHSRLQNLFVCTGGSGHAFKFLPVIGEKVVACLLGDPPLAFREKWCWPERVDEGEWEGDGSRGGRKGMVLGAEYEGNGARL